MARKRKTEDGEITIDELKEQSQIERENLQRQVTNLTKEARRLREKISDQQEFAKDCAAAITAAKPFKPWVSNLKRRRPTCSAAIDFSDWHIGEVVRRSETEGFNEFNWQIAQDRINSITTNFLRWVETQRMGYKIDEIAVFAKGDYVSGDIHSELKATNEFPLPVQAVNAGRLLGDQILRLSTQCRSLKVVLQGADNHGRLQPKPQAKQKHANNISYICEAMAQQSCENQKHIEWVQTDAMKTLADVGGWNFLIEHGDTVRGWAGLPHYGFMKTMAKESLKRMNTDRGFHYWSIAHFHVPNFLDNRIIVNGSLSGTSEFDHACGRHAPPCQVGYLVGRHGVFNFTPFQGL